MSQSPTEKVSYLEAKPYKAAFDIFNDLLRQGASQSGRERNCVFLNTRGPRFATVSAVSGLDFSDDGRAVAVTDWDQDGDLDLWLANRTGPQLRFMRNDAAAGHHFLALRLQGTKANRDAIGARVQVFLKDDTDRKLVQTLHAGEGYLSQSSKWLHFGLGDAGEVDRVEVRWPGGGTETFSGLETDRRYRVVEGSGRATRLDPLKRKVELAVSTAREPRSSETARIVLPSRVPLPELTFTDDEARRKSVQAYNGQPLLLNLWASWCAPCVAELKQFTREADAIRDRGLQVLTLGVNGLGDDKRSTPDQARVLLARLDFPFDSGAANEQILEKLEMIHRMIFNQKRPYPVPTSFLIDRKGELAVIYKGPVEVEQLLADLDLLEATPKQLRDAATLRAGRWFGKPKPIRLEPIAGALHNRGFHEDAARMYTRILELNPKDSAMHRQFATLLDTQGQDDLAMHHYRRAIEVKADNPQAHYGLAVILAAKGRHAEAAGHYREALRISPKWGAAANDLAWLLATTFDDEVRDGDEAVRLAEFANQYFGDAVPEVLGTLGTAYAAAGRFEDAQEAMGKAVEVAERQGRTKIAGVLLQRLMMFQEGRPYRQPPQ